MERKCGSAPLRMRLGAWLDISPVSWAVAGNMWPTGLSALQLISVGLYFIKDVTMKMFQK